MKRPIGYDNMVRLILVLFSEYEAQRESCCLEGGKLETEVAKAG